MTYYYSPQLYHHGILGQSWGKRNGPPYPLGASQHSASERKAGWRKSLDKDGSESDSEQKPKKKGLSDKQKKALKIGAAVVGAAALAAGATYVAHKADVKLTNKMRDYYGEKAKAALKRQFMHEGKAKYHSIEAGHAEKSADFWKKSRDKEISYRDKPVRASESLIKSYDRSIKDLKSAADRHRKLANKHTEQASIAKTNRQYYKNKQFKDKYDKYDRAEYKKDIKLYKRNNNKKTVKFGR